MTYAVERAFAGRRVLVTGGAGFVGGAVVGRLVEQGARVTVLDDLFTGRADTLPTSVQFVEGSVTDAQLVRDLVADASVVFHMAARNIIASTKNPRDDFETNIGGTLNVLLAARDSRPDRVVYTSSASVYGNPRSIPINEDDPLVLLSPYAVSKLGGENYCNAFYESYGLPVAVVRYSNVFGEGQRPDNPYCGVVSKFFAAAMAGDPLQIHGDGEQTRDYTYVDDAVAATLMAAIHPRAEGEVFNIGTGIETSVNALAVGVADCVPVFIAHPSGIVALLHSGWRGTAAHITTEAIAALARYGLPPDELAIHLGPAICGRCYEVSAEVREQLTGQPATRPGHVDLRSLIAEHATETGVQKITVSSSCTRCDNDRFFSHRAGDKGRQIGVIVAQA